MMKKFPIIRPAVNARDIWRALFYGSKAVGDDFFAFWMAQTNKRYVFLTNSGLAAFYLALNSLKNGSSRREVVLPAYTAGSLVVAVKKAGLKPILCDIQLDCFNTGTKQLLATISSRTLAIVAVHMFGLPLSDISGLKEKIPSEVCFIEDCAQADGSKVNGLVAGRFGEISFFSFNRGKNFSIFGGGCITTNNPDLAKKIEIDLRGFGTVAKHLELAESGDGSRRENFSENAKKDISQQSRFGGNQEYCEFVLALKMWSAIIATDPYVYGLVNSLLSRFKENAPPKDFKVRQLSALQIRLGKILIQKREDIFQQRNRNGEYLSNGLKFVAGIRLADIPANCYPVYNRLPVLFEDLRILKKKEKELAKTGFEVSRMYLKPLHRMFELGYKYEDFPNADYFSEHVLTLPVYPGLKLRELDQIIEVIKK